MNKYLLTFWAWIICGSLIAQNTFPSSGNVGIGTNSPTYNLSIRGNSMDKIGFNIFNDTYGNNQGEFFLLKTGNTYVVPSQRNSGLIESYNDLVLSAAAGTGKSDPVIKFQTGRGGANSENRMIIDQNGKIGIGTVLPGSKLEVNHDQTIGGFWNPSNSAFMLSLGNQKLIMDPNEIYSSITLNVGSYSSDIIKFRAIDDNGYDDLMIIRRNGNVGIGTTTPDSKLSVNGNIRAREIKLETSNWPDYVFGENYRQLSLEEVEDFIKANGHLPGLKSAEEYQEEGVNMMELNQMLLEKIEEMTLHLIEKDKEIKSLKKLEDKMKLFEERLNQLEE